MWEVNPQFKGDSQEITLTTVLPLETLPNHKWSWEVSCSWAATPSASVTVKGRQIGQLAVSVSSQRSGFSPSCVMEGLKINHNRVSVSDNKLFPWRSEQYLLYTLVKNGLSRMLKMEILFRDPWSHIKKWFWYLAMPDLGMTVSC